MNKKCLSVLLSSAFLVGGISTVAAESAKPFSGFYVGAGVGYSAMNATSKSSAATVPATANKKDFSSQTLMGKVFVGYEMLSQSNLYGALEGYFLVDHQKAVFSSTFGATTVLEKFSRQTALGLGGKLGGSVCDNVLLYGLLGGETSRFSIKGGYEGNKRLWAIVPGIGATFVLSETIKLSVEATHAEYQTFKVTGTFNGSTRVNPSVNTLSLGISKSI